MKIIKVLFNIVVICIILLIAIYFPNMVSSYLQESLEGKLNYVDVGVKTYEVKFNNIWEKLLNISKCERNGELKTVPIAAETTEELKENLVRQVMQQFNEIQKGMVYKFPNLKKENLISYDKYAIYSANEGEANGISFWKLKFQGEEESIQILMDTEFNCIYLFHVESKSRNAKRIVKQCIEETEKGELPDSWLRNIRNYFALGANGEDIAIIPYNEIYPNDIYQSNSYTNITFNYIIGYEKTKEDDIVYSKKTSAISTSDKFDELGIETCTNLRLIFEYQKKENILRIDGGIYFDFFDYMIQF